MSAGSEQKVPPLSPDLYSYLEAASESSSRARISVLVLVVGSVLALAGLLNSLSSAWMLQRVVEARSKHSVYVLSKLGYLSSEATGLLEQRQIVKPKDLTTYLEKEAIRTGESLDEVRKTYDDHYEDFFRALVNTYTESAYTIRLPFFGASFDMNDLGIVGGIGFAIILLLVRFTLSREFENLKEAFAAAKSREQIVEFYKLLSMRQVLTIPPMRDRKPSAAMIVAPRVLCVLPLIVHGAVIVHDFATAGIGWSINYIHTIVLYCANSALFIIICFLTVMIVGMWKQIDVEWERAFAMCKASDSAN